MRDLGTIKARVYKDDDGDWVVEAPNLPNSQACTEWGGAMDLANEYAKRAKFTTRWLEVATAAGSDPMVIGAIRRILVDGR